MNRQEDKIGYQFTAVPTNLYQCCDINVRSMLSTLVQLSSYYADRDGWFFRTNDVPYTISGLLILKRLEKVKAKHQISSSCSSINSQNGKVAILKIATNIPTMKLIRITTKQRDGKRHILTHKKIKLLVTLLLFQC